MNLLEHSNQKQYSFLPKRYYSKGHKFWLLGHIIRHKKSIILISATSIIGIFLQTVIPFILGDVFENALPDKDLDLVLSLGILIITIGLFKLFTNFFAAGLNEVIAQNVEMNIRIEFYENLERKSMSFHDSSRIGNLMSMATGDTRMINASVSPGVRLIITTLFSLVFTFVAMLISSPTLSLIFVFALPFYLFTLYKFGTHLHPLSVKRQKVVAQMNADLQENLTGVRVVRTFSGQEKEINKFSNTIDDLRWILEKRGIASAFYFPSLILGITTALIFLVASYLFEITFLQPAFISLFGIDILVETVGIGELITFLGLTGMLSFPTMFLRWILDMTLLGIAGANRIFSVIDTESMLSDGDYDSEDVKGLIEFNNVSFSYKPDSPNVINNVNLKIAPGETLAIIGPTGCGKTTLGKLINRLYDVNEGEVLIDGINVKDWSLNRLRKIVGTIEQDTFLFSTSIKENIRFGKESATDEEIIEAATLAQADEFISEYKENYETIVGERGITLSGGQKQRLALARGFLANPKILIMDDATSAVDAETEAKIQTAINNLVQNRTTIIITHRLSTLKGATKVAFMDKGFITKIGSHERLIKTFEPYRRIFARYSTLPPIEINIEGGSD